jgi:hypothetical protein
MDGAPRAVDSSEISNEAKKVIARLGGSGSVDVVLVRESGRYMRALFLERRTAPSAERADSVLGDAHWRLIEVSRQVQPDELNSPD